jgi:hypothetical protein
MRFSLLKALCLPLFALLPMTAIGEASGAQSGATEGVENEQIQWRDDKFHGTRTYEISRNIKLSYDLKLSVFATSRDGGKSPPPHVNLYFHNKSSGWEYMDFHPLVLLVDGKRFSWGEKALSWDGTVESGYVLEHMQLRVPPIMFRQIGLAKVVEGRLGLTEFVISYEDREAFRTMSRSILRLR